MSESIFFWTSENRLLGRLHMAASDNGLRKVALGREPEAAFHAWVTRASSPVRQRTPIIEQALVEVDAYLSGELRVFHTPLDLRGTSFQRQVWADLPRDRGQDWSSHGGPRRGRGQRGQPVAPICTVPSHHRC